MENIIFDFISMLRRGVISEFDGNYLSGNKSKTFSFDELFESTGRNSSMNFFPSDKKGGCYEIAMFVSFHKPIFKVNLKRNQMVSLDEVLKKLVQQVFGKCYLRNDLLKTNSERMQDLLNRIKKSFKEVVIVKLADRITNLQPPPKHWSSEKGNKYKIEAKLIFKELNGINDYIEQRL